MKDIWGIGAAEPEYNFYSMTKLSGKQQFSIPTMSVFKIFNNITGLFSPQKSSIFVVNVTEGDPTSLDFYQTTLGIPDATGFLMGLRYMVQEYLLRGLVTTRPAKDWYSGFSSDIFSIVSQGDYYAGNDKDLINLINPVFSSPTLRVANASIKINSGSSDVYQVGKVEQVNGKPFVNSLVSIFDGNTSNALPVNLWD